MFRSKLLLSLFLSALILPLFANYSGQGLTIDLFFEDRAIIYSGVNIHLGMVMTGAMMVVFLLRMITFGKLRGTKAYFFLFFLLLWFTISLCIGLLYNPGMLNALYYGQTIFPALAFILGVQICRPEEIETILKTFVFLMSCLILVLYGYILYTMSFSFLTSLNQIRIPIPQFKRYFPIIYAVSFSIILSYLLNVERKRIRSFLVFALHLSFLPLVWSRACLLTISLVLIIQLALHFKNTLLSKKILNYYLILVICFFGFIYLLGNSKISHRFLNYAEIKDSNQTRINVALSAGYMMYENPLWGTNFIPQWDTRIGGRESVVKRLIDPHNQYLDYGLKGGFIGLFLFIVICSTALRKSFHFCRTLVRSDPQRIFFSSWFAALVSVMIASLFQLNFTITYTGTILWFLLGVSIGYVPVKTPPDKAATVCPHRSA